MSSLNKKFMAFPLVVCFVLLMVCTLGFAGCNPGKVRVTLDADGGYFVTGEGNKECIVLELDAGSSIEVPSLPVRNPSSTQVFTFDGWDTLFPTHVSEDMVIKAKWTSTTRYYTVTINANGGTFSDGSSVKTSSYQYGQTITLPAAPTKAGTAACNYVFDGYTNNVTMVTADVTLTAKWVEVANRYTITYNANGGSLSDGIDSVSQYTLDGQSYGAKLELPAEYDLIAPASTLTTVYEFDGWLDSPQGQPVTKVASTATVYAKWVARDRLYDITFDAGTGAFPGNVSTRVIKLKYGDDITYTGATPVKSKTARYEYIFQGFNIPDGATVTGDTTFTAVFAEADRLYNVTFDAGEGYFGNVNTKTITTKFKYDELISTPNITPAKDPTNATAFTFEGYEGWTAESRVTGEGMVFEAAYTESARMYDVTFDAGNGYFDGDATHKTKVLQFAYNAVITAPNVEPTRDSTVASDYTFAGYSYLTADTKVTGEGMTFSALYTDTVRQYNITFDANGGKFADDETRIVVKVNYGEVPSLPAGTANPTKAADAFAVYNFAGWTPTDFSEVSGDTTYTAYYSESVRTYTASFYDAPNGELLYSTSFKAAKAGYPVLSDEQMAELNAETRVLDSNGYVGEWRFTLLNKDCDFYKTSDVPGYSASYFYGDGTQTSPYLIDNIETAYTMIKALNDSYDAYNSADSADKINILNAASSVYYRLIGDVDLTVDPSNEHDITHVIYADFAKENAGVTYEQFIASCIDDLDLSTSWFIGHLDAKKSNTENYKLLGLNPDYLSATDGALFWTAWNAEFTNLDVELGEYLASIALYGDGDYVIFDNVNIANAAGVARTYATPSDNNEGPYISQTFTKRTVFRNCTNNANITSQASYFGVFVGGYIGNDTTNKADELTFVNCVNNGKIVSSSWASMLYGNPSKRTFSDNTLTVEGCVNNGSITASGPGLFIGKTSSVFTQEMVDRLNAMVTNNGTLETLSTITGTVNAAGSIALTAAAGTTFAAGKYTLDVTMYANEVGSKGTLRIGYTTTKVLEAEADVIDFEINRYKFIERSAYDALANKLDTASMTWYDFTGYRGIKYAYDDVNGYVVFDFNAYRISYTIDSTKKATYIVTRFDAEGEIVAYCEYSGMIQGYSFDGSTTIKADTDAIIDVMANTIYNGYAGSVAQKDHTLAEVMADFNITEPLYVRVGRVSNLDVATLTLNGLTFNAGETLRYSIGNSHFIEALPFYVESGNLYVFAMNVAADIYLDNTIVINNYAETLAITPETAQVVASPRLYAGDANTTNTLSGLGADVYLLTLSEFGEKGGIAFYTPNIADKVVVTRKVYKFGNDTINNISYGFTLASDSFEGQHTLVLFPIYYEPDAQGKAMWKQLTLEYTAYAIGAGVLPETSFTFAFPAEAE